MDIRRFIKEELGIKPNDALIVKMDIESFEWPVLKGTKNHFLFPYNGYMIRVKGSNDHVSTMETFPCCYMSYAICLYI